MEDIPFSSLLQLITLLPSVAAREDVSIILYITEFLISFTIGWFEMQMCWFISYREVLKLVIGVLPVRASISGEYWI